ncbi:MAG: DUF131 domain-containing protein [Thermoplasmata archaeon]|jgi:uncharacterized membrane protein|nr:DUF131 domain-containing protein [Thermoplasmata archaeon]
MGRAALLPLALFVAGAALIADSLVRGSASVALLVVLPIFFGSSAEFLGGVVLLLAGFLTLPLALPWPEPVERPVGAPAARAREEVPSAEVGGFVLIGPVPVFFGSWKSVPTTTKLAVAAVGAALLLLVIWALYVR